MFKRYSRILLFSASSIVFISNTSCKEEAKKKERNQTTVTFKKEAELQVLKASSDSIVARLDIEIADNEFETQTGLMYRDTMRENHGMLFIFPDSKPRSFYMKNTRIPLDIIYLNSNKRIVSFQENAKPMDESSLPSNAAAKYVLEVNAGLVKKWQLEVGDFINYQETK